MAVSLLKPPFGGFRRNGRNTVVSKLNGQTSNGYVFNWHFPADVSVCSDVTEMQRPLSLAKVNGFILVLECLPGVIPDLWLGCA
jgi:hypothetical protein